MPFNTCNRMLFGQNCQNQIIAVVLLSRWKLWFVLCILVFLQTHLLNSFFEIYALCFSPFVLRMIVFVFRFHFQHNVASGSDTHFNWEDCSKSAVLSFAPFLKIQDVLKNPKFAYSVDSCRLSSSVFLIFLASIYSMKSQNFFCASIIFFADLRFHSVQREFQSPKSPRPPTMIHISSYSNLISETTSFFIKFVVKPPFFLECYYKIDLWVGSLHWKPSLL